MSTFDSQVLVDEIDAVHRDLARLSVDQLHGMGLGTSTEDVIKSHPLPLESGVTGFLREEIEKAVGPEEESRLERLLFACMDLAVEEQTGSLRDMVQFYIEHGWMHVGSEKIQGTEVVPWLQAEPDFDKREEMRKENSIYLKGLLNHVLLGILELTVRATTERFGFENYVRYSEAKHQLNFDDLASQFSGYLERTGQAYQTRMKQWVEEEIGRPFENLSRYHALYLMRIKRFDAHFPAGDLPGMIGRTFGGLGFDPFTDPGVFPDISVVPGKSPRGMCVGVEIPGEVHIVMKPVDGLIDYETLLHETGHAFFLSNMDPGLPVEYRRLYRSAALDETFAFLFMDLAGNRAWLTTIAGMQTSDAEELARLSDTRRLCLIRRHIGKFLAEKDLLENGNIKDPKPYCTHLKSATGFDYEPAGYLIDMEPDFYALDYVRAWAGANSLRQVLEQEYGEDWFTNGRAGGLLKEMARTGRRYSLDETLELFCGKKAVLPDLSKD